MRDERFYKIPQCNNCENNDICKFANKPVNIQIDNATIDNELLNISCKRYRPKIDFTNKKVDY